MQQPPGYQVTNEFGNNSTLACRLQGHLWSKAGIASLARESVSDSAGCGFPVQCSRPSSVHNASRQWSTSHLAGVRGRHAAGRTQHCSRLRQGFCSGLRDAIWVKHSAFLGSKLCATERRAP
jgi:hypothetical protein